MTKSLGPFTGGALSYWPEDDGTLQVEEVSLFPSSTVDTQGSVVLFDGNRCHAVQPFVGERFSLVFFVQSHFSRAPKTELAFLEENGLGVPTEGDLRFFLQDCSHRLRATVEAHSSRRFVDAWGWQRSR